MLSYFLIRFLEFKKYVWHFTVISDYITFLVLLNMESCDDNQIKVMMSVFAVLIIHKSYKSLLDDTDERIYCDSRS